MLCLCVCESCVCRCFILWFLPSLFYGQTDDTVAFKDAVAAAASTAGCVRVPAVKLGKGFVITDTVIVPAGVKLVGEPAGTPQVPWCFKGPGDLNSTGGSRIFARVTKPGHPLFHITAGCSIKGLYILHDTMPFPTDEEFSIKASPFYYKTQDDAIKNFYADHVPKIGPTIYVEYGIRVFVQDVIAFGFSDFLYYAGRSHGQGSVRNIQGWGYGRFVTVEQASDVLSFDNLRYIVNAGPHCLGPRPSEAVCNQSTERHTERCRGSFTLLPAIVALHPGNVGLWLGRSDGYRLTGAFFFGVNTAVRLGFAPGSPYTALRNPVTGRLAGGGGGVDDGSLLPGHGPWGSVSQLMVDQAQIGIHFVWPNPLTNRFVDIQLHPSFWDKNKSFAFGSTSKAVAGNGTGLLTGIGMEAAILYDTTHTISNNNHLLPTTLISNCVVAAFADSANFGVASSGLQASNGRAFLFAGDSGLVEVAGFAMNNEKNGDTHLWASAAGVQVGMRAKGLILNYEFHEDVTVRIARRGEATATVTAQ